MTGVNNKNGLLVLMGLPASGKTMLANKLSKYIETSLVNYKVHIISYDDAIPISVQCGSEELSWKAARAQVIEQVDKTLNHVGEDVKNTNYNNLIIIDDNMYYRSMRYKYFQLARKYGMSYCQLYLSIPLDDALYRNKLRSPEGVPEDVITKMFSTLEPPDMKHNNWEYYSITISSLVEINYPEIRHFLDLSLSNPVPPIKYALSPMTQSFIHETDLKLRKLVGGTMKRENGDKRSLQSKAKLLNEQRQLLLHKLRAGDITLPEDDDDFLAQQFAFTEIN